MNSLFGCLHQARGDRRCLWAIVGLFLLQAAQSGCASHSSGTTETDAKTRLTKVLRLYQVYVEKNRRGPPDKQALKDLGQKLTPQERDEYLIGDDLDAIFTSPRDQQEFVIAYGLSLAPGGETQAVAWEATGDKESGKRYVALSMGYVEEYDDAQFQEYQR
jgi:hypothetical protein